MLIELSKEEIREIKISLIHRMMKLEERLNDENSKMYENELESKFNIVKELYEKLNILFLVME